MAAVSYSLPIGKGDDLGTDEITVGANAPAAVSTIEFRVDVTTTPTTRKEMIRALNAFARRLESQLYSDFPNV